MRDLTDRALDTASSLGAGYADIRVVRRLDESIAIRTASPATRSISSAVRRWLLAKPPRPVDEDADAESLALAGGHALDAAGPDRDALVEPADDPDIRIARAQR